MTANPKKPDPGDIADDFYDRYFDDDEDDDQ